MVSLKNEKSFIYLWKISIMVCVYEILSRRECWDTYELKEIVLFPEIILLGVNSIKYMYIKNHYYNTQISSLKNQHAIQWTTGGSEISHLSVGGTYWEATVDHQRTHEYTKGGWRRKRIVYSWVLFRYFTFLLSTGLNGRLSIWKHWLSNHKLNSPRTR